MPACAMCRRGTAPLGSRHLLGLGGSSKPVSRGCSFRKQAEDATARSLYCCTSRRRFLGFSVRFSNRPRLPQKPLSRHLNWLGGSSKPRLPVPTSEAHPGWYRDWCTCPRIRFEITTTTKITDRSSMSKRAPSSTEEIVSCFNKAAP